MSLKIVFVKDKGTWKTTPLPLQHNKEQLILPQEVWILIWSFLDFKTLQKICIRVSKSWMEMIRSSKLSWEVKLRRPNCQCKVWFVVTWHCHCDYYDFLANSYEAYKLGQLIFPISDLPSPLSRRRLSTAPISYCWFLMSRPLKWGLLDVHTIILSNSTYENARRIAFHGFTIFANFFNFFNFHKSM